MKSFRRLSLGIAIALAAAVCMNTSAKADVIKNNGVIRAIRGSAQFSRDKGATWKKATVGQRLGADSAVRTSEGSTVDVFLGENGPVVRINSDTTMGIDRLDIDNTGVEKVIETQLDLKNGQILGSVKKMAAASKYEVKTPVGVAGIRGTEYSINSKGELHVISGTVIIVYVVNGQMLPPATVTGGNQATPPPAGQGNTAIVTGLSAATLGSDKNQVTLLMVDITVGPSGEVKDNKGGGGGDNKGGGENNGNQGNGNNQSTGNLDTTNCSLTLGDPARPTNCPE